MKNVLPVNHSVLPVDHTVLPVDHSVLPIDHTVPPVLMLSKSTNLRMVVNITLKYKLFCIDSKHINYKTLKLECKKRKPNLRPSSATCKHIIILSIFLDYLSKTIWSQIEAVLGFLHCHIPHHNIACLQSRQV